MPEVVCKKVVLDADLRKIIEKGEIKYKSNKELWVFMFFNSREDNLVCAAIVLEHVVVVKTVMIEWEVRYEV